MKWVLNLKEALIERIIMVLKDRDLRKAISY